VGGLREQVAAFVQEQLGSPAAVPAAPSASTASSPPVASAPPSLPARPSTPALDFVAEEDVRRALRDGKTLRVSRRAIITPSARDYAAGKNVLIEEGD